MEISVLNDNFLIYGHFFWNTSRAQNNPFVYSP